MKKINERELAQYDGKNGALSFIAFRGKIYDVSSSFLWKQGVHQVFHNAGRDLTDSIEEAPHGVDLLEKFPIAGTLGMD